MKQKILLIFMISLFSGLAAAQDVHRIIGFDFDIDGHTRENALIKEMDIKSGDEFPDLESLQQAVLRQEQDLINLRVFNEVVLTLSEPVLNGELLEYSVLVKVEDSWTIYPIPYPKYESGEGFRLGLKVYYDNAFGTLNNLYLGMNITFKYDSEESKWNNTEWSINPQYNNVKIGDLEYNFSVMQQKSYSEKKTADGLTFLEKYTYYNSAFDVKTSFHFGQENKYFYSVSPGVGWNYSYDGLGYQGKEEPFYLIFSHGGGYSKVDWIGNFREGFTATAGNSIRYIRIKDNPDEAKVYLNAESKYYKIIHPRMNYSARLYGTVGFNDEMNGLGSNIRGVEPSTMYGIYGFFLSNDMNFSVIRWKGVGEAQFQPFFDIGFSQREGESLDMSQDLRYGTGADFILYLDKLKGLHARATIGIDLSNDLPFSDLGKYELIITSSLSY